jgi:hypothetical protein
MSQCTPKTITIKKLKQTKSRVHRARDKKNPKKTVSKIEKNKIKQQRHVIKCYTVPY